MLAEPFLPYSIILGIIWHHPASNADAAERAFLGRAPAESNHVALLEHHHRIIHRECSAIAARRCRRTL